MTTNKTIFEELEKMFHNSGDGRIGCIKHEYRTECVYECIKSFFQEKLKEKDQHLRDVIEKIENLPRSDDSKDYQRGEEDTISRIVRTLKERLKL